MIELTKQQARRFLLAYQGLLPPHTFEGKAGILEYIRRVGCIQYDPLDIVGNNPALVLQSRVDGFRATLLGDLLYQDRKLLDGLDKNMAIYPVEDWPYFRRWRESARTHSRKNNPAILASLPQVRAAIESRGPISALDLDLDEKIDWDWSDSRLGRAALESLYFWGELVIHHRVHTRKFYDLLERHLPAELLVAPEPNPTPELFAGWHIHRRIGSVGLVWNRGAELWLGTWQKSPERKETIERLVRAGQLREARVAGLPETFYYRTQDQAWLARSGEWWGEGAKAAILAPLDNLLWDRRLLNKLFDFEYTWEVYLPAEKRRYGYYVLPILYGDRFIARFEPGRDKKQGLMQIKNWWWEPGVTITEELKVALADCFRRFLQYLGDAALEISSEVQAQAGLAWLV